MASQRIVLAISQGVLLLAVTLAALLISLYRGHTREHAPAISFTTLVLGNLALIWSNRSRTRTIPEMLASPNRPLWAVTAGALLLLALVLNAPSLRALFEFSYLHIGDLFLCSALALIGVTGVEVIKLRGHS
jgi:Ca2+-transporting ATPase